MANVKLVIEMTENTYKLIQALTVDGYFEHDICGDAMRRIANGTVFPKGHGDLKDVSNLLTVTDVREDGSEITYVMYEEIENAPIILPADKESESV